MWKKFAEKGRIDEQIRILGKVFNKYREKIVEQIYSIGKENIKIFNKENSHFTVQFETFLQNFFNNIEELNKKNYSSKVYEEVYNKFNNTFYSYLYKRLCEKIICEITFEDGYSLYKLFEAFEKINSKIFFRIDSKKIEAYTINETKICLIRILFRVKKYQFYYSRSVGISLNLKNLIKLLKCKKNDKVQTSLIFKVKELDLQLYSKINKSRIIRTIKDIEENLEYDGILEELLILEHSGSFEIDESKIRYLISQSGRFSEAVKLTLTKEFIKFSEENSVGVGDLMWKRELITNLELESEEIIVYFSIKYLEILINFMVESNTMIKFFLNKETAMKMKIKFKSLENSHGLFFIAQREPF